MEFYSHTREINGRKTGSKLLKQHLSGVCEKALQALYPLCSLSVGEKYIKYVIKELTLLHDLGKYTTYFQKYLLGEQIDQNLKSHSLTGALYALNKFKDKPFLAALMYFLIVNHHGNFINILDTGLFSSDLTKNNYIKKQIESIHQYHLVIEKETNLNDLKKTLLFPDQKIQREIRKTVKLAIKKNPSIHNYFTINYLFSLLIESDKLDASDTQLYLRKRLPESAVENFIGKVKIDQQSAIEKISGFEQNKLRNWVRATVLENLNKKDILEQNIFTLTAPTGIGKTLTVLDFALHLRKMIHEKEKFEPQIIYSLPFINIIEQGIDVYKQVFHDFDANILGHYQYADIFGENDKTDNYNQKIMQINTWQSDIVITSFVQFFETLISNRNKMLLKFNHLAGSIVILDEVQTLKLEQLPLIGAALFFLTKYLNTRIILMTATKPKIFDLANREILEKEGEKAKPFELLNGYEKVFAKFNRTKIVPLLEKPVITENDFFELFKTRRDKNQSCLIVCNTVKRSIDIFNKLKENGLYNLYYLSTNIVPAVRLKIIKNIKKDIEESKSPILVSTQVVEAGVDLDFEMGFRDLGPIDSIVQVAGRINRENNAYRKLSPLYILDFQKENGISEATLVYDSLTKDQTLNAFKGAIEIKENEYLHFVDNYFSGISEKGAFNEARNYYESMKVLKYDSNSINDFPVSKFKIIKESPWAISVFVELNNEAEKAYSAYIALLRNAITKKDFDKYFKKSFNRYIIAVPAKFTTELKNINKCNENIKLIERDLIDKYYNLDTGFIRGETQDSKTIML